MLKRNNTARDESLRRAREEQRSVDERDRRRIDVERKQKELFETNLGRDDGAGGHGARADCASLRGHEGARGGAGGEGGLHGGLGESENERGEKLRRERGVREKSEERVSRLETALVALSRSLSRARALSLHHHRSLFFLFSIVTHASSSVYIVRRLQGGDVVKY